MHRFLAHWHLRANSTQRWHLWAITRARPARARARAAGTCATYSDPPSDHIHWQAVTPASEMETSAIELHTSQLRRFGFTVVPNVIPADEVDSVAASILRAGEKIGAAMQDFRASGRAEMREGWADLAKGAIAARGFEPNSTSTRTVEQHNHLLASVAEELRETHGLTDPYNSGVPTGHIDPGINHIAYYPELSRYLADPRVLAIAKAVLDPHVRIAQLEINKTNHPAPPERLTVRRLPARSASSHVTEFNCFARAVGTEAQDGWETRRGYHSDWPHDITHVAGGHVAQPFPDVTMALSTVWYFVDVGPENGSTWVVPGSVSKPHVACATWIVPNHFFSLAQATCVHCLLSTYAVYSTGTLATHVVRTTQSTEVRRYPVKCKFAHRKDPFSSKTAERGTLLPPTRATILALPLSRGTARGG